MRVVHFRTASAALLVVGCSSSSRVLESGQGGAGPFGAAPAGGSGGSAATSSAGGIEIFIDPRPTPPSLGAPCDPSRTVESNGDALLVRDPDILSRFSLERVLAQIVKTAGSAKTPTELLQRLFDTENTAATGVFADNAHCDDPGNEAFSNGKPVQCPRVEGKLAKSTGFFAKDDPDSFVPVALVNRFDLMPTNFTTCGEYRIVYAKQSGRTDPSNRVFLIFESALPNPETSLAGCRPVAELWAGLPGAPPGIAAQALDAFFFGGTSGAYDFGPAVHAQSYGGNRESCGYAGTCGQVRVGQGMEAPWEFRQFRIRAQPSDPARFVPVPLTSTLRPELFDLGPSTPQGDTFSTSFVGNSSDLANAEVSRVRLTDMAGYEAGESALAGGAVPNYASRVAASDSGAAFLGRIADGLGKLELGACPPDDPISAESILQRATAVTCAGCHAPESLLSAGRKVGCGAVWPRSLGQAHVDERGALSEALTDVFLPHRASVLETYLRACDAAAIVGNLQPSPSNVRIECFVAGTPITMADGATKPIELVEVGDLVLSFDEHAHTLSAGRVQRTVVRHDADHLISINGTLVATDNHPFRTTRGWVRAEALRIGDELVRAGDVDPTSAVRFEAEPAEVRELAMRPGTADTYNLDVAGTHGYVAGGFLVHDRP